MGSVTKIMYLTKNMISLSCIEFVKGFMEIK